MNIGEFSVPKFTVVAVFYCGVDGSATEPVFQLTGESNAPMDLGPVTVEALEMELIAYTYKDNDADQGHDAAEGPQAGLGLDYDAEGPAADRLDYDYEISNATHNSTKSPIHVAGFITGYIVVNLTSDLGHPALVGLKPAQLGNLTEGESELTARATFSFDSRTNTFAVSAEIRYEDDYVLIVAQAAASTDCGKGDVQSIMGTIDFKPASKIEGSGKISGFKHCSDSDDAAGYELSARLYALKFHLGKDMELEIEDIFIQLMVGVALPDDVLEAWVPVEGYETPGAENKIRNLTALPLSEAEDAGAAAEQTASPDPQQTKLAKAELGKAKLGGMADMLPSQLKVGGKAKFRKGLNGGPSIPKLDASIEAELKFSWGGGKALSVDSSKLSLEFEVTSAPATNETTVPMVAVSGIALFDYP